MTEWPITLDHQTGTASAHNPHDRDDFVQLDSRHHWSQSTLCTAPGSVFAVMEMMVGEWVEGRKGRAA